MLASLSLNFYTKRTILLNISLKIYLDKHIIQIDPQFLDRFEKNYFFRIYPPSTELSHHVYPWEGRYHLKNVIYSYYLYYYAIIDWFLEMNIKHTSIHYHCEIIKRIIFTLFVLEKIKFCIGKWLLVYNNFMLHKIRAVYTIFSTKEKLTSCDFLLLFEYY